MNKEVQEIQMKKNVIGDIHRHFKLDDGCWLWHSAKNTNGYGCFGLNGRVLKAHRAMYEYFYECSPGELDVCHRCDTPACVRPSHLFLGTQADNMRDAARKGRFKNPSPNSRFKPGHTIQPRRV